MLPVSIIRHSSLIQVKCTWYCMGTIVSTVKRNNCKTPLPEVVSTLIFQTKKKKTIKSNYKSIAETPNKEHLLHLNLLFNHNEARLIIVLSSKELQDTKKQLCQKNNSNKKNKKLFAKNFYIMSHHL